MDKPERSSMTVLTPRQIPAAIKRRILSEHHDGGKVLCSKCHAYIGDTESPRIWSKGDRVNCPKCGMVIALPTYGNIQLDLTR